MAAPNDSEDILFLIREKLNDVKYDFKMISVLFVDWFSLHIG